MSSVSVSDMINAVIAKIYNLWTISYYQNRASSVRGKVLLGRSSTVTGVIG